VQSQHFFLFAVILEAKRFPRTFFDLSWLQGVCLLKRLLAFRFKRLIHGCRRQQLAKQIVGVNKCSGPSGRQQTDQGVRRIRTGPLERCEKSSFNPLAALQITNSSFGAGRTFLEKSCSSDKRLVLSACPFRLDFIQ
jgi:hypothetical protein